MVHIPTLATAFLAALHAKRTVAHPGEHHTHEHIKRELAERSAYGAHIARSLEKCARSPKAAEINARAMARREAATAQLRARAGLDHASMRKRDEAALESWGEVSHNETGEYTSTTASTLFGSNTSCVLTPEDIVGPYYVLGELIRSDVTETQTGVPVHLDMQFIDVSTCEPAASSLLIDIWHANATGTYSGITGEGGLNTDFLRGVQQTDDDGVVQFDTIFPGHYQGRATHLHITSHVNATVLSNDTYSGGTVTHIGQLFFEEALRSAVEAVEPYASNSQPITSNNDDTWAPDQASTEYDPYPKYLYLGDSIDDGLVMWISVGVDMSADYTSDATAAAYWGEDGGYTTGNQGSGGSGGAPGSGASGVPSGAMPSGSGAPTGGAGGPGGTAVGTMSGAIPSGSGAPASGASGAPSGASGASGAPASSGSAAGTGSVVGSTVTGTANIPVFSSAAGVSTAPSTSKGNVGSLPSSSTSSSSVPSSSSHQQSSTSHASSSSTQALTAGSNRGSSSHPLPSSSSSPRASIIGTTPGAPANSAHSVANSAPGGGGAGRGSSAPAAGGDGRSSSAGGVKQVTASTKATVVVTAGHAGSPSGLPSGSGMPSGACRPGTQTPPSGFPSGVPSGVARPSSGFKTLPSGSKVPTMSGQPAGAPADGCGGQQQGMMPGGNGNGNGHGTTSHPASQSTARTTARTTAKTQSRRWFF